jgi:heme/copper-type cytochrome/quinol oxidase subunit 4
MRFAWLSKNSAYHGSVKQSFSNRLVFIAYNVVWWIPIVLAFTKIIDYRAAFIAFFVITIIRACVNLYRNNFLNPEQAESYPLRAV